MSSIEIEVGDTVAIKEHQRAPKLYPSDFYTVPASGGWTVCRIDREYTWGPYTAYLYKYEAGRYDYRSEFCAFQYLSIESKGNGAFVPGETIPLSEELIYRGRCEEIRQRFANTPVPEHEGFVNSATWLACFLLSQDTRTSGYVSQLRRKDGTINPDKMRKLFSDFQLKLEEWVSEPHIEIPEDLRRIHLPDKDRRLGVDWQEVAEEFALKASA